MSVSPSPEGGSRALEEGQADGGRWGMNLQRTGEEVFGRDLPCKLGGVQDRRTIFNLGLEKTRGDSESKEPL